MNVRIITDGRVIGMSVAVAAACAEANVFAVGAERNVLPVGGDAITGVFFNQIVPVDAEAKELLDAADAEKIFAIGRGAEQEGRDVEMRFDDGAFFQINDLQRVVASDRPDIGQGGIHSGTHPVEA